MCFKCMTFFEKVTLDVGGSTLSVYKLNVQILSQTPFKKKGSYNSTSLQWCRTILSLEEKMRWSLRQEWPFQRHYVLREVWDAHLKQASMCVFIKHIHVLNFFKWSIVSLDKIHIHRLVSFIAALKLSFWPSTVWSPLKLTMWSKSCNVFIKNLHLFSTEERNT